jgi:putative endonuclease
MREYYVYIMTNKARTLYVGVTNNLERRVSQHKEKHIKGFTSRYNLNELAYYAPTNDVREAIAREKQIKGWTRAKKIALIEEINPNWDDLSDAWYSTPKQSGSEVYSSLRSE